MTAKKPAMDTKGLKFDEKGLIPAIAQDAGTSEVLMMAYMDAEALEKTLSTGRAHYYSRSRKKLWLKGETSGNYQDVRSIHYDCDADTLLLMVDPKGPACHTGERTCFYRGLAGAQKAPPCGGAAMLKELSRIVKQRRGADPSSSYVASLYSKGLSKILEKVEEESGELVEAAREKGKKELVHETADLWFHTVVLLAQMDVEIDEVFRELARRFGRSGIEEKASREKK